MRLTQNAIQNAAAMLAMMMNRRDSDSNANASWWYVGSGQHEHCHE
jgi:hypothetical protein